MRYRPEEEAAYPLSSVVNFEPLAGADLVFWYSPTGERAFDAFFIHGGFFSPNNAPAGQSVAVDLGDIDVTFNELDPRWTPENRPLVDASKPATTK